MLTQVMTKNKTGADKNQALIQKLYYVVFKI